MMLFVLLSAVASVSFGTDLQAPGLSLLQMRAEKLDARGETIANQDAYGATIANQDSEDSPMQRRISEASDVIDSQLHAFESSVAETENQQQAELKAKKVEYATQLMKRQEENRALATTISNLTEEIEHLHDKNAKLRHHALEIKQENHRLVEGLRSFEANLTLAQEFVEKALDEIDAPELLVLKELDDEDMSRKVSEAHRHRLDEIAGADRATRKHAVFLETHDEDAKELLRSLEERLGDMMEAHEAGEAALRTRFYAKMAQLETRHADLVSEYDALEGSQSSLVELGGRLKGAVRHLEHYHGELEKQTQGLTNFLHGLGDQDQGN